MYSIQNQKRDVIYYRPNVKKLYVHERNKEGNITFEIRVVIDNDDRLLGVYSNNERAKKIILDMINDNFWRSSAVYCMPEDEPVCL